MKAAMVLGILAFSGASYSHDGDHDPKSPKHGQRIVVSDSASATAKATAGASASSVSGGGDASASSGGNSLVTNEVRQTPPAYAPTIYPTGTCLSAGSIGGSIPGFAITGGKTARDSQCEMRETARLFAQMGQLALAVEELCATDAARVIKDCKPQPVIIQIVPEDPNAAPTKQPDTVTHSELNQVEQRITERVAGK